ncbi:MAG: hypothetical protein P8N76_06275 [Pirellulaceae bacterium]|nr:hypothetical protein [Pirellulaceae bacterium]
MHGTLFVRQFSIHTPTLRSRKHHGKNQSRRLLAELLETCHLLTGILSVAPAYRSPGTKDLMVTLKMDSNAMPPFLFGHSRRG